MCHGRSVVINGQNCKLRLNKGKYANILNILDEKTGEVLYTPSVDVLSGLADRETDICLRVTGGYESILNQLIAQKVVYPKFHVTTKSVPLDVCEINFR